jgi:hypothetical protein
VAHQALDWFIPTMMDGPDRKTTRAIAVTLPSEYMPFRLGIVQSERSRTTDWIVSNPSIATQTLGPTNPSIQAVRGETICKLGRTTEHLGPMLCSLRLFHCRADGSSFANIAIARSSAFITCSRLVSLRSLKGNRSNRVCPVSFTPAGAPPDHGGLENLDDGKIFIE